MKSSTKSLLTWKKPFPNDKNSPSQKVQNLPCKTEFYFHEIKNKHFNINSFALSLALEQRIGATLYWRIPMSAIRT